jgi:hypothetical protein
MVIRIVAALLTVAAACATWTGRPMVSAQTHPVPQLASRPDESMFADILHLDHPLSPLLDRAYQDLEAAMRPHGCTSCHAPELATGGRRARLRHAAQVLDTRRAIEAMVDANLMPPARDGHPAGIADEAARALLLRRARVFRTLGDDALASW